MTDSINIESFIAGKTLYRGRAIFAARRGEIGPCPRCGATVVDVVLAKVDDDEGGVLAETGETFDLDDG